jgi:uncharacterized membrane protein YphA (DoxX/SURF4 family)
MIRSQVWFWRMVAMLLVFAPAQVLAHEKWFTDSSAHPLRMERLWSAPTLLAIAASIAVIGGLWVLRALVGGDNLWPRIGFLRRFDPAAPVVIAIQTAIALIFMAVNLFVLAPNLRVPLDVWGLLVAGVQVAIAFTFISGAFARVGGGMLALLVLLVGLIYGLESMLEQTIYAGIGIYMLLQGRGLIDPQRRTEEHEPFQRYQPYALTILRLLAGFSFVILAFTEKLLNPDLGVAFLREYPNFNVGRLLGWTWFTDERFVLAAGMVELAVGAALISGVLPRLVIFGMFVPFNLTIPFLPPTELLGHLPIFAVMYVLMFHMPTDRMDAEEGAQAPRWSGRATPRHGSVAAADS